MRKIKKIIVGALISPLVISIISINYYVKANPLDCYNGLETAQSSLEQIRIKFIKLRHFDNERNIEEPIDHILSTIDELMTNGKAIVSPQNFLNLVELLHLIRNLNLHLNDKTSTSKFLEEFSNNKNLNETLSILCTNFEKNNLQENSFTQIENDSGKSNFLSQIENSTTFQEPYLYEIVFKDISDEFKKLETYCAQYNFSKETQDTSIKSDEFKKPELYVPYEFSKETQNKAVETLCAAKKIADESFNFARRHNLLHLASDSLTLMLSLGRLQEALADYDINTSNTDSQFQMIKLLCETNRKFKPPHQFSEIWFQEGIGLSFSAVNLVSNPDGSTRYNVSMEEIKQVISTVIVKILAVSEIPKEHNFSCTKGVIRSACEQLKVVSHNIDKGINAYCGLFVRNKKEKKSLLEKMNNVINVLTVLADFNVPQNQLHRLHPHLMALENAMNQKALANSIDELVPFSSDLFESLRNLNSNENTTEKVTEILMQIADMTNHLN